MRDYWFEQRYQDALFGTGRDEGYNAGRIEKEYTPRLPDEESYTLGYKVGYQEGIVSFEIRENHEPV